MTDITSLTNQYTKEQIEEWASKRADDAGRLSRQLLATMQRERELWGCLKELVLLKEHKDKCGKTLWYEEKQPKAWANARKALEARCEYPVGEIKE
jgi:hypothetical protein